MIDGMKLRWGILQSFICFSRALFICSFSLGRCNSIASWSTRLSMPAVTVGCCLLMSLGLCWFFLLSYCCVPVQSHLPATSWVVLEEGGWRVKEQTFGFWEKAFGFCLFPSTLLLELVCTAEIAAFSNCSWKGHCGYYCNWYHFECQKTKLAVDMAWAGRN